MRSIVVECVVPLVPSRADEVETMAKSIGYEVVDRVIQHRKSLHHTYCIGPGKLDEIKQLTSEKKIEAVLFANRLPGSQVFKIQKVLGGDRKSTRLNSSHRTISYAVFCLKKKRN